MAFKLKKYPKKPKANASLAVKERYLDRVKEIDRENRQKVSDRKKSKDLTKKIQKVSRPSFKS